MLKTKFGKKLAAGLTAIVMTASASAASISSLTAFAGNLLGEGTFENGAGLPWHVCENGTGSMAFDIADGVYSIGIKNPGGTSEGGEDRWDCQFRHRGLTLEYGHTYRLTYAIYASKTDGMGNCYAKIGDINFDDCEYWHNNGTKLDMGAYKPNMSMSDLESALKNASASGQEIKYYEGWDKWKSEKLTAKQWTVVAYEFKLDKSELSNTVYPDKIEGTAEWTFHFGGDGQYTPSPCFTADTVLKFDNLCLLDMTDNKNDYKPEEVPEEIGLTVNQVGYYPLLKKTATLQVKEGAAPVSFEVKDSSGKTVYTGKGGTTMYDKLAWQYCQVLDFSDFQTEGEGYTIVADGKTSLPFAIGNDILDGLLTDSMNYYYLNRSGVEIEEKYISDSKKHSNVSGTTLARKAGHKPDKAMVSDEWVFIYTSEPSYSKTVDVTGGWYDAGDYGKYVVNGGLSMWTLANIYEMATVNGTADKWADGSGTVKIPETGNGVPDVLDELCWEADFFMAMQREDGMVYHKIHDYKWTALGVMPYADSTDEKVLATAFPARITKPVTYAATLNTAAALAQLSRLIAPYDATAASKYLASAEKAYKAAKDAFVKNYSDIYAPIEGDYKKDDMFAPLDQNKGGGPYGDTQVSDEFYWAACELYITTEGADYKKDVDAFKSLKGDVAYEVPFELWGGENAGSPTSFTWGTVHALGTASLALHPEVLSDAETKKITESFQKAGDAFLDAEDQSAYGSPYKGCDYKATVTKFSGDTYADEDIDLKGAYEWGSNSMVINNAMVLGMAYNLTNEKKYIDGVSTAFDYILGNNAMENSYVTGWGTNTTNNPHHRYWCNQMKSDWPKAPSGCLSGGPNSNMNDPMIQGAGYKIGELAPMKCYYDQVDAWSVNEITINWNAPLVWISSFLEDEAPNADGEAPIKPTAPSTGDPDYGDVNCDGDVDIMDVIMLNKNLLGGCTLTDQGKLNADVDVNGKPEQIDSMNIMKYIVGLITSFPVK